MIATLVHIVRRLVKRDFLQRYKVVVFWEGERFEHLATSLKDAREWAACYPDTCSGYIDMVMA